MLKFALPSASLSRRSVSKAQAMSTGKPLDGNRILIFVADEYEDLELWYPKLRLEEAGVHVTVAGPEAGKMYRGKHGYPCAADAAIADMESADFQGVLCPGGWMPDKIRRDPRTLALVRECAEVGKLVAAICHGPWTIINAGAARGRRMTSWPSLEIDLRNAGAQWVDEEAVTDQGLVTSRKPDDIPAFNRAMIDLFSRTQARQPAGAD